MFANSGIPLIARKIGEREKAVSFGKSLEYAILVEILSEECIKQ